MGRVTKYNLVPLEELYEIGGRRWLLREASEDVAMQYRGMGLESYKFRDSKLSGIDRRIVEAEPWLVAMCLYELATPDRASTGGASVRVAKDDDETDFGFLRLLANGEPDRQFLASAFLVKSWPSRVVRSLFDRVKEISDLSEGEKDPDPELVSMCRKELTREYPAQVSPEYTNILQGINLALDWIKRHAKDREGAEKNGSGNGEDISPFAKRLESSSTS
jgi:hypothetical protein